MFAEGSGLHDAVRVVNNAVGVHTQDGAMLLEKHGVMTFSTKGPEHAVKLAVALENIARKYGKPVSCGRSSCMIKRGFVRSRSALLCKEYMRRENANCAKKWLFAGRCIWMEGTM